MTRNIPAACSGRPSKAITASGTSRTIAPAPTCWKCRSEERSAPAQVVIPERSTARAFPRSLKDCVADCGSNGADGRLANNIEAVMTGEGIEMDVDDRQPIVDPHQPIL